jgi:hypothetical protein
VTKEEHRPRAHREWGEWPAERLVSWARTKGPKTAEAATAILERGPHPESGRRACLGLMRLGEQYDDARLEAACLRALTIGSATYKSVKAILRCGLEKAAETEEPVAKTVVHDNIRGGEYFDRQELNSPDSEDAIEARYLEEERQAIILESTFASTGAPDRPYPVVEKQTKEVSRGAANAHPIPYAGAATEPLPALLGRLQTLLARPRPVVRIGRLSWDERGGVDSGIRERDGTSCSNESACIKGMTSDIEANGVGVGGMASGQRERMVDEKMCEIDEACEAFPRGGRGGDMG